MAAAVALRKQKNQAEYTAGFNEEYIVPPVGRGIAATTEAMVKKNQNNPSGKDDGYAPSGGIAVMAVHTVPETKKIDLNRIKTNKGESVPPDGVILQLYQMRH